MQIAKKKEKSEVWCSHMVLSVLLHVLDVSAHSDKFLYNLMLRCISDPGEGRLKHAGQMALQLGTSALK